MGFAVDQSPTLSYFFGDRYIQQLKTSQFTVGVDYQLTQKYQIIATESFDTKAQRFDSTIDPAINPNVFKGYVGDEGQNILTSVSLVRRMPRFNFQVTLTYDANQGDTTFSITAWPEGLGGGNLPGSAHAFTSGR